MAPNRNPLADRAASTWSSAATVWERSPPPSWNNTTSPERTRPSTRAAITPAPGRKGRRHVDCGRLACRHPSLLRASTAARVESCSMSSATPPASARRAGTVRRCSGPCPRPGTARPGLVVRLEDFPIERILCSPTVRCHQPVQPLARDRLLRIEREAALGVDGSAEIMPLVLDRGLQDVVLCTHGETIGQLLAQLATRGLATGCRGIGPRGRPGCCGAAARAGSAPSSRPRRHWTTSCAWMDTTASGQRCPGQR
jgi:hypothetical protein